MPPLARSSARAVALVLLAAACLGPAPSATGPTIPASQDGAGKRVLFVGNSLTYVNTLPLAVRALSRAAGADSAMRVGMVAYPDYSLEDHWGRGDAARTIAGSTWDVVVLQQGPSSLESSRALLVDYAVRFAGLARAAKATPALYAVWPTIDRQQDFARASESYRIAADSVHGLLFPVGDAWRAAARLDPAIGLYAADGLHPSPAGTYLAALVITRRLTGRTVVGMPASLSLDGGGTLAVPASMALVLQRAAEEVTP